MLVSIGLHLIAVPFSFILSLFHARYFSTILQNSWTYVLLADPFALSSVQEVDSFLLFR